MVYFPVILNIRTLLLFDRIITEKCELYCIVNCKIAFKNSKLLLVSNMIVECGSVKHENFCIFKSFSCQIYECEVGW